MQLVEACPQCLSSKARLQDPCMASKPPTLLLVLAGHFSRMDGWMIHWARSGLMTYSSKTAAQRGPNYLYWMDIHPTKTTYCARVMLYEIHSYKNSDCEMKSIVFLCEKLLSKRAFPDQLDGHIGLLYKELILISSTTRRK